jgi:hypothetical protein
MPEGDEVYVTIGQAIPYVNYVVTAYKVVEAMYNFGRESETDKAIRLLTERVEVLEQAVKEIDDRLSELEERVSQVENRDRVRTISEHQLEFSDLARDLASHPENAVDIAAKALGRLRAMYNDDDLWMWSDILRKPDDAPGSWRPAPPAFKGVGLPTFAIGTMIWALAADIAVGVQPGADELLPWIVTRTDWIPYVTQPVSLSERFRASINIEIIISTKYVTPAGYCEFAFVGVNGIDRTRTVVRNVDMYFGPSPTTMCTADPRIAEGDEAVLEDESSQLKILRALEDAVTRIRDRGVLADPVVGRFETWTAHRLALYGIEPSGQLRRYQLSTTTALTEPPSVTLVGEVVGTGWQNFTEVLGTYDVVQYAFSEDGAVDWYRHEDFTRGPSGWQGPRRVRPARAFRPIGEEHRYLNGGSGTFFLLRTYSDRIRIRQALELVVHPDPSHGSGAFGDSSMVVADWPWYRTTFGGGMGVIYGIDTAGDLYWHRHSSWPDPGSHIEGPSKIGNGWNGFSRVFAFGAGFIAGIYPSGEMWLYHFQQWRWGPRNESPQWHGPMRVPGTQWRGFKSLVPMVGDEPSIVR